MRGGHLIFLDTLAFWTWCVPVFKCKLIVFRNIRVVILLWVSKWEKRERYTTYHLDEWSNTQPPAGTHLSAICVVWFLIKASLPLPWSILLSVSASANDTAIKRRPFSIGHSIRSWIIFRNDATSKISSSSVPLRFSRCSVDIPYFFTRSSRKALSTFTFVMARTCLRHNSVCIRVFNFCGMRERCEWYSSDIVESVKYIIERVISSN